MGQNYKQVTQINFFVSNTNGTKRHLKQTEQNANNKIKALKTTYNCVFGVRKKSVWHSIIIFKKKQK